MYAVGKFGLKPRNLETFQKTLLCSKNLPHPPSLLWEFVCLSVCVSVAGTSVIIALYYILNCCLLNLRGGLHLSKSGGISRNECIINL